MSGIAAAPAVAAEDVAPDESVCAEIAQQALDELKTRVDDSSVTSFACLGSQVVATANAGSADEVRVQMKVRYSDSDVDDSNGAIEPYTGGPTEEISVPYAEAEVTAGSCDFGREVKSELEDFVWDCTVYGQYQNGSGVIIWERSIDWEWTMYPGWPSAQNKLRTIPSAGSPKMQGTFTSWKQNGILPPENLALTVFTNNGNTTTTGWLVDGLNTGGQFSVWIGDIVVTDPQKSFEATFWGNIPGHRFTCDSDDKRCYFPDGEEAGI